jgi:hypothetical protein
VVELDQKQVTADISTDNFERCLSHSLNRLKETDERHPTETSENLSTEEEEEQLLRYEEALPENILSAQ